MGDVINLPGCPKPVKSDNLGDYDNQGYGPILTLLRGAGIDVEVVQALCAHCKRAGIKKCHEPHCDIFDGT